MFFLLGLFHLELFFDIHCLWFYFSLFRSFLFVSVFFLVFLLLIVFLFVLFGFLFLWNFGLFGPFLYQVAVLKCNKSIFGKLNFKADCECFLLRILSWGLIVSDMLFKTSDSWLILNENFNWLLSFEFDSFG